MCTLSLIALTDGSIRVACNRDEARTRAAARPPQLHRLGPRTALFPVDPASGGTWLGVTDAGLAAAVLNRHASGAPGASPGAHRSRGEIVPRLLAADSLPTALALAGQLDAAQYPPFRVIILNADRWVLLESDGQTLQSALAGDYGRPVAFFSSGLGDDVVGPPRLALFEEMLNQSGRATLALRQDAFHRHSWPDRPHLSVCMRRAAARTVSFTVLELTRRTARMSYLGDAPDQPGHPWLATLDWRAAAPEGSARLADLSALSAAQRVIADCGS